MPFEPFNPRPFTPASVQSFAPSVPGLYGLSNANDWIYIGTTENIQAELMSLLRSGSGDFRKWRPTGFVFEICAADSRSLRQNRLVMEYEPICNRQLPE